MQPNAARVRRKDENERDKKTGHIDSSKASLFGGYEAGQTKRQAGLHIRIDPFFGQMSRRPKKSLPGEVL